MVQDILVSIKCYKCIKGISYNFQTYFINQWFTTYIPMQIASSSIIQFEIHSCSKFCFSNVFYYTLKGWTLFLTFMVYVKLYSSQLRSLVSCKNIIWLYKMNIYYIQMINDKWTWYLLAIFSLLFLWYGYNCLEDRRKSKETEKKLILKKLQNIRKRCLINHGMM